MQNWSERDVKEMSGEKERQRWKIINTTKAINGEKEREKKVIENEKFKLCYKQIIKVNIVGHLKRTESKLSLYACIYGFHEFQLFVQWTNIRRNKQQQNNIHTQIFKLKANSKTHSQVTTTRS